VVHSSAIVKEFFRHNGLSILVILLVPLLALHPISFFFYTMKWDMMDQFFPCRFFISECLQNGQLPLWSPFINYGYPFHADPQSGVFYPVTWLFSLLGGYNVYTIAAEYLLHIFIAALSFYAFLRQFKVSRLSATTFGITYALSGVFISNAQHLTWVVSMAWMPMVVLLFYRLLQQPQLQSALAFSLTAYLFMTGGYPGFAIILFYFLVAYSLLNFIQLIGSRDSQAVKNTSLSLATGAFVFALISSGFIFSIVQAMPDIARSKPVTLAEANSIAFTPQAAVSFLFPFVNSSVSYAYTTDTDISMTNIYMGIFFFPLFIVGLWKTKQNGFQVLLLIFGLVCLLAALGDVTPVRSCMYQYLPGMNVFRHAAIFRAVAMLSFLGVAAAGFDWLIHAQTTLKKRVVAFSLWVMLLFLIVVLFSISRQENNSIQLLNSLTPSAIEAFNRSASIASHFIAQAAFQLILVCWFIVTFIWLKTEVKKYVLAVILLADISAAAYLNLPSTAISNVKPRTLQAELDKFPKNFPIPSLTPIGDFGHVSDISTDPMWFNISFFKKTPSWGGFNNFYPKGIDDLKETPTEKFVKQQPVVFTADSLTNTTLAIQKFRPGYIQLSYGAKQPVPLTLLQSNFKGWEANCDGQPLPISKVYMNFMQCEIPAGRHQVTYIYNPKYLQLFIGLGVFSLIICSLVLLTVSVKKLSDE
jgi:hypothetical protein